MSGLFYDGGLKPGVIIRKFPNDMSSPPLHKGIPFRKFLSNNLSNEYQNTNSNKDVKDNHHSSIVILASLYIDSASALACDGLFA